jgi:hypothetical protein
LAELALNTRARLLEGFATGLLLGISPQKEDKCMLYVKEGKKGISVVSSVKKLDVAASESVREFSNAGCPSCCGTWKWEVG